MSTNYIDQITDTAGTTHDISEGDSTRIFRATCSTAAATVAKIATLDTSNRNFSLAAGVRVAVTFKYANTAATPTLNINSTGAKLIYITDFGGNLHNANKEEISWGPYETIIFTYNGTGWLSNGSAGTLYWLTNTKTSNTGTVTSVGITAGGGISISGSPITTSGSITVGHSNSVTAQTTQAVYPIKIDAQGHISAYGSAVTIPSAYTLPIATSNTLGGVKPWYYWQQSSTGPTAGTINASATVNARSATAGRYYAVEMDKDGRMFVNVPWTNVNSSYITSDSDEKVKVATISASTNYYPVLSTNTTSASTKYFDNAGFKYIYTPATSSDPGFAELILGNNITYNNENNKKGLLTLYSNNDKQVYLRTVNNLTASRGIGLPDKDGTIALTSDITDEKLTIETVYDSTSTTYTYYPILARKATTNGIRQIDETGFRINNRNGSTDEAGLAELILGNATVEGTENNKRGWISIYNRNDKYARIYTASTLTANREIALPDKSGTIALTSDVPDVSALKIWYGECSTAAATAAKTVSITDFPTLASGMLVAIKFTNSNSVASPTLSINSGTAHSIIRYGTSAPSTSVASSWAAGAVVLMIYDGTYWRICSYKDNSTYAEISVANITNLTGSSSGLVTGRRFKSAFDTNTENGAAATTNYDKANIKNIIESTVDPGTTTAPNGTLWLKYGDSTLPTMADYVVEQHVAASPEDNWSWTKWNSGKAECWIDKKFSNVAVTTTWGSCYSANLGTVTFPFTFVTTASSAKFPMVLTSIKSTSARGWIIGNTNTSLTTTETFYFIAPTSYTSIATIVVRIYAVGLWK